MPGDLLPDRVLVREQSEANRIYSKGHFGKPLSGGALQLDLLEAAYLLETDRLEVRRNGDQLSWADLLVEASRTHPGFEIAYLVYRDLRERGYLVQASHAPEQKAGAHFRTWPRGTAKPTTPHTWVRAVSERAPFRLAELERFTAAAEKTGVRPLHATVDEESDLTYYQLSTTPPPTRPREPWKGSANGILLADRALLTSPVEHQPLHEREFFGKPIASGLQLSLVESLYLVEQGVLHLVDGSRGKPLGAAAIRRRAKEVEPELELRLRVYRDLKTRGLLVKTGFKFGTHFRVYEERPETEHAPYLVQAVPADYETSWAPIARAVRLSHSVRKQFYLAAVEEEAVRYLSFGRFRP